MNIKKQMCILLSLLICTSNVNIAFAATLDDIRQMYGLLRVDNSRFKEESQLVVDKYNEINDYNNEVEYINSFNLKEKYLEEYEQYKTKADNKKLAVDGSIKELAEVSKVFELYYEYKELQSEAEYNKNKYENAIQKEYTDNDYTDMYNHVQYKLASESDKTDYGETGRYMKSIVADRNMEVLIPFGTYYDDAGNEIWNYGLYLKLPDYISCNILSTLHGIVKDIRQDENGQYIITIGHGDYMETTYWYLDSCNFNVGDAVRQYDIIGSVNKEHERVYLDFKVDGEYVNPLTLYQEKGVELYNKFLDSNSSMIKDIETIMFDNVNNADIVKGTDVIDSNVEGKTLDEYEYTGKKEESGKVNNNLDLVPNDIREAESTESEQSESSEGSVPKEKSGNTTIDLNKPEELQTEQETK